MFCRSRQEEIGITICAPMFFSKKSMYKVVNMGILSIQRRISFLLSSLAVVFIVAFLNISCENSFSMVDILDGNAAHEVPEVLALTLTPSHVQIIAGQILDFDVEGGEPPYLFTLESDHGSIDSQTGLYEAPAYGGTDIVIVTDNQGATARAEITVVESSGPIVLSLNPVESTVFINTILNFTAGGGISPYSYSVVSGIGSIDGSTGQYVAPSTTGSAVVRVTDQNGDTADSTITISSADVDYEVNSISNAGSSADTDSTLNETFTIENTGSSDGAANILWTAYISADLSIDGGDQILMTGSTTALTAGSLSSSISLTGNWPSIAGQYYILLSLTASDDSDTQNNQSASALFQINSQASEPDYYINSITQNFPIATTGSIISESFQIVNLSNTGGSSAINWTAYASTDNQFGSDIELGSGTADPLPGSGTSDPVYLSANWSVPAESYYLFIVISADDEILERENNRSYTGTFTIYDPPDYSITIDNASLGQVGQTGIQLAGTPMISLINTTVHAGQSTISWEVFASTDTMLSPDDDLINSGGDSPLGSGEIRQHALTGTWPLEAGFYYLIGRIYALDDTNGFNDIFISKAIAVGDVLINELESNDSLADSAGNGWSTNSATGITLESGDSLVIEGTMDSFSGLDVFGYTTGTGVTGLNLQVGWDTGYNEIDYHIYSATDGTVPLYSSAKKHIDFEPESITLWTGYLEYSLYYLAVEFFLDDNTTGSEGSPYAILIKAP